MTQKNKQKYCECICHCKMSNCKQPHLKICEACMQPESGQCPCHCHKGGCDPECTMICEHCSYTLCQGKDGCGKKILLSDLEEHVMGHTEEGWEERLEKCIVEWMYLKDNSGNRNLFPEDTWYPQSLNAKHHFDRDPLRTVVSHVGLDQLRKTVKQIVSQVREQARRELAEEIIKECSNGIMGLRDHVTSSPHTISNIMYIMKSDALNVLNKIKAKYLSKK